MLDICNGFLKISDELTIFPGFSFEQFENTRFYKNQDGEKYHQIMMLEVM